MRQTLFEAQVFVQKPFQIDYQVQSERSARYSTEHEEPTLTCSECLYFQKYNDDTNKGWCELFDHFVRSTHEETQDCVNTIYDEQEEEINQEISQQSLELVPEYEIDSVKHAEYGEVFRLWKRWELVGSFYQSLSGKWIALSMKAEINGRFNTDTQAILILIAIRENPELQRG